MTKGCLYRHPGDGQTAEEEKDPVSFIMPPQYYTNMPPPHQQQQQPQVVSSGGRMEATRQQHPSSYYYNAEQPPPYADNIPSVQHTHSYAQQPVMHSASLLHKASAMQPTSTSNKLDPNEFPPIGAEITTTTTLSAQAQEWKPPTTWT
jgi:hypothetical protein